MPQVLGPSKERNHKVEKTTGGGGHSKDGGQKKRWRPTAGTSGTSAVPGAATTQPQQQPQTLNALKLNTLL
eukprot:4219201-Amphidinium_carterae.1